MVRKIPIKKKMKVLLLYFMGFSMDKIGKNVEVSKGSVVNIIKELKGGKYPEFDHVVPYVDELRALAVKLKKTGRGVSEATLGIVFYERLRKIGVEPTTLEQWVKLCRERLTTEEFPVEKVMESALKQIRIEAETGKTYEEQLKDFKEKSEQTKKLELGVTSLEAKRLSLKTEIGRLDRELKQELKRHGLRMERINKILKLVAERLRKKGLSQEEVEVLIQLVEDVGGLEAFITAAGEEKLRLESQVKDLRDSVSRLSSKAREIQYLINERSGEAERLGSLIGMGEDKLQQLVEESMENRGKHEDLVKKLTKEISELLDTKADIEQIQKAKADLEIKVETLIKKWKHLEEEIELAAVWTGLLKDSKQLGDQAVLRFVEEIMKLKQIRIGKTQLIRRSNGKVLHESFGSHVYLVHSSLENVKENMKELLFPLIKDDFILKEQHDRMLKTHEREVNMKEEEFEKKLNTQKEESVKKTIQQMKVIKDYEIMCNELMLKNKNLEEENRKLKIERGLPVPIHRHVNRDYNILKY